MANSNPQTAQTTVGSSGFVRVYRRSSPEFWHRVEVYPHPAASVGTTVPRVNGITIADAVDRILAGRKRQGPDTVLLGGVTEPYPVEEKKARKTKLVLEVIAKHGHPLLLITRSNLVLRDIDLLREIDEGCSATVALSIPTFNATALRRVQPRSMRLSERLEILERICRSGLQTGLVLWPHVPQVNDRTKDLITLFRTAQEMGIDFVLVPFADGSFYRRWWNNNDRQRFQRLRFNRMLLELSKEYRVRLRPKRFIPKDRRAENYWLAGKLGDEAYRLRLLGQPFRSHLTAASILNNLKHDVRNLLKFGGMDALPKLPTASLPDVERLLKGDWADEFDLRG